MINNKIITELLKSEKPEFILNGIRLLCEFESENAIDIINSIIPHENPIVDFFAKKALFEIGIDDEERKILEIEGTGFNSPEFIEELNELYNSQNPEYKNLIINFIYKRYKNSHDYLFKLNFEDSTHVSSL